MKGKNERLVELLGRKTVDTTRIEAMRREIAATQDEIQKEIIAHILETKSILDAKQQNEFFALMGKSMATGKIR